MWFRVSKLNFKTTWKSSQKSLVTGTSPRARRPSRYRKSWLQPSACTGLLALPFRFMESLHSFCARIGTMNLRKVRAARQRAADVSSAEPSFFCRQDAGSTLRFTESISRNGCIFSNLLERSLRPEPRSNPACLGLRISFGVSTWYYGLRIHTCASATCPLPMGSSRRRSLLLIVAARPRSFSIVK